MSENQPNQPTRGRPEQPGPPEAAETGEQRPTLHPQIWVGSLLDYNAGILHGDWLDAAQDDEALAAEVQRILAASPTMAETGDPAEEYGIFDHEDFGLYQVQEYDQLEHVAQIARGIAEHGAAFAAWADLHDGDPNMLAGFQDAYLGEYDAASTWAETVMDDLGVREQIEQLLPEHIARYTHIDTRAWVHDAWISGDIAIVQKPDGSGVWIFDARQ